MKSSLKWYKPVDGNIHAYINHYVTDALFVLAVIALLMLGVDWVSALSKVGLLTLGARLATKFSGPDTDLIHSVNVRAWGNFGWIWAPYREFIAKGHRGLLSHGITAPRSWRRYPRRVLFVKLFGTLIGTGVRTLYLLVLLLVITLSLDWVLGFVLVSDKVIGFVLSEIALYLLIGFATSDLLHVSYDRVTSHR